MKLGVQAVMPPTTEEWGQRTCTLLIWKEIRLK